MLSARSKFWGLAAAATAATAFIGRRALSAMTRIKKNMDEHEWLEDIYAPSCLNWAKSNNERTISIVGDPKKEPLHDRLLAIYENKEKIPGVTKIGNHETRPFE